MDRQVRLGLRSWHAILLHPFVCNGCLGPKATFQHILVFYNFLMMVELKWCQAVRWLVPKGPGLNPQSPQTTCRYRPLVWPPTWSSLACIWIHCRWGLKHQKNIADATISASIVGKISTPTALVHLPTSQVFIREVFKPKLVKGYSAIKNVVDEDAELPVSTGRLAYAISAN